MLRQHSGRTVAALNGTVAVALVVLVAGIALVVRPPAPPGIAEFAPRASKPISKALPGQSSPLTTGRAGCVTGAACPDPSRKPGSLAGRALPKDPRGVGVPSALQCHSWPDGSVTQTFDPQSPPCIASWPDAAKGNGGATSRGVTGTTIRIVAPDNASGTQYALVASFFNTHFQLYGRHFQLITPPNSYRAGQGEPSTQRANAAAALSVNPFAATSYSRLSDPRMFADQLAAHRVITALGNPGNMSSSDLAKQAPYQWSYPPTIDLVERNLAEMLCRSIPANDTARYGGPGSSHLKRKFAVLIPDQTSSFSRGLQSPQTVDLSRGLARCGVPAKIFSYAWNGAFVAEDPDSSTTNNQLMLTLKTQNFTSLIAFGDPSDVELALMGHAEQLGYQPEWVAPGVGAQGSDYVDSLWASPLDPADQRKHLFGIAPQNKVLPLAQRPSHQALVEQDPHGTWSESLTDFYHEMLMLASGVQAAGPHLTPQTFAAALEQLEFPNPGAGAAPFYQARVGFGSGEHVMQQDYAAWSWSDTTPNYGDSTYPGARCVMFSGRRWSLGNWPATPLPLFAPPC